MHEEQNDCGVFVLGDAVCRGLSTQLEQLRQSQAAEAEKARSQGVSPSHHPVLPQQFRKSFEHEDLANSKYK